MLGKITKIKTTKQLNYLNEQENIASNITTANFDLAYFAAANFDTDIRAEFYGQMAERLGLGLSQPITSFEQVERLAKGLHPLTKEELIKPVANRVEAFEFSFSAEKSISLLAEIGTPEQKKAIKEAHRIAVKQALDYIMSQDVARKGKAGKTKIKGECIASIHHHDESRELDPQIHSHCVLYNLAFADGKFGSFNSETLFKKRLMAGQVYQNALAIHLKDSGIPITTRELDKGSCVAIDGMPEDFVKAFSKRTDQIENYLKTNNLSDNAENRRRATLNTRKEKDKTITPDQLKNFWRFEFKRLGFDTNKILNSINNTKQKTTTTTEHDISASIDAFDKVVLDKKGTNATKDDLLLSELQLSIGKQSLSEVYKRVEEVYSDERIIKIGNNIATKNLLTREEFVIDFARTKEIYNPVKNILAFNKACDTAKEISGFSLNEEQKQAVNSILFSESNVVAIQGKAGTGKSSLLLAATLALQLDGRNVYGTATAGKAAAGLLEAGMNEIDNSAALLQKLKTKKIQLKQGDVIVIDEAGMMNTAQFYALAKYAEKAKAKIVSLGDYEQLQAIGAGGIHKLICDTCGYVELKEVFRQKDKDDAAAGLQISAGNAIEAINHFKDTNCYKACDTKSAMIKEIASNLTSSKTSYENKFAVADTRELGRVLSNEIQKIRLQNNEVKNPISIEIHDPNEPLSQLSQNFAVGDRIAFLQGAKKDNPIFNEENKLAKVQNGHFGTIIKIVEENHAYKITVKHDKLGEVYFNTNEYKTFALGYAGTLHKSQGATLKECHWGTENPDKHKGYVAATRHTEKNSFFLYTTKDAEAELAKKMSTASYNKSVKELLEEISKKKSNYTPMQIEEVKIQYKKPSKARLLSEIKTVNNADTLLNAKSLLQADSLLDKLQKQKPLTSKQFIEKATKIKTPVIPIPLMTSEDWEDRFLINKQKQKINDTIKITNEVKNQLIQSELQIKSNLKKTGLSHNDATKLLYTTVKCYLKTIDLKINEIQNNFLNLIIETLEKHANPFSIAYEGKSALDLSREKIPALNREITKFTIEDKRYLDDCLLEACKLNDTKICETAIDNGANPDLAYAYAKKNNNKDIEKLAFYKGANTTGFDEGLEAEASRRRRRSKTNTANTNSKQSDLNKIRSR